MNYYDRPEWQQWLAAIRANPDDDTVRLVAADWLDEVGACERAEFVRVQVELAKGPQCRWAGPGTKACAESNERLPSYRVETWCEPCHRFRMNYGRSAALADGIYGPLLGPVALAGGSWLVDRGFLSRVSGPLAVLVGGECSRCRGCGRYDPSGSRVRSLPCSACHGTGRTTGVLAELLRREPVGEEGIVVTGVAPQPVFYGPLHYWQCSDSSRAGWVPYSLIDALYAAEIGGPGDTGDADGRTAIHFTSAAAARLALSRALYRLHAPQTQGVTT